MEEEISAQLDGEVQYMRVFMFVCMSVCIRCCRGTCVYVSVCVCVMCVCVSVYVCICRGVETASHAGHCPINLVNVR